MRPLAGALALVFVVSDPSFSQTASPAPSQPAPNAATATQAVATASAAPNASDATSPSRRIRVFVTESDSWQMAGSSGGASGAFGGGFSGGASPQTAEVIKTIGQRCPDLKVNSRVDASDYVIRLDHEGGKGLLRKKDKVAVFQQKSGDSIYSASTLSVGGSVQGACEAIAKDWVAYSAQLAASPSVPQASPAVGSQPGVAAGQMASLSVESSVAGADIEIDGSFVGSTPSTLSVAPGQHTVTVKKKGYEDWTRSMNVAGTSVHLSAELASKAAGN